MTLMELINEISEQGGRLNDAIIIRHNNFWYNFKEITCDDELITIKIEDDDNE